MSAAHVRARIAAAFDRRDEAVTLGRFTLRPDQRDAVARVAAAIDRFSGALLCDPPGSGKTVVALAVARRCLHGAGGAASALVLAPAALREQWLRSARDAQTPIAFHSLESVSRGGPTPASPLVIVDEAHRIGAEGTTRYRRIAELAAKTPVLMLTATPVVNRLADRERLLSLFLGSRVEVAVEDVVIRREGAGERLPEVRRLPPLDVVVHVTGLADALRTLPPPFPLADGRAATALVISTLAFAWRSSLAALSHALARRESRGRALEQEIASGRWPDRTTLRRWIVGDEPAQLSLELEFARSGRAPPADALTSLRRHLDAVRDLRARIAPAVAADTAQRASTLVALLHAHAPARVVCFAHHAETIRALWSELRSSPGVVAITGERVRAAAGRWSRDEVLAALGPAAAPWRADDPRGIRLLLTTDLLAEGVELPGVEIVVHGDGAWTPARLEQRVGRARRPSNRARTVLVTGFDAPAGSDALLRLAERLRAKRVARRSALHAANATDALLREIARWRDRDGHVGVSAPQDEPIVGAVVHDGRAFLALLENASGAELLAGQRVGSRWRTSVDPRALLSLAERASRGEAEVDRELAAAASRVVRQWLARRSVRSTLGAAAPERSPAQRQLRRILGALVEKAPLSSRSSLGMRVQRLRVAIDRARTARTDRELRTLLRSGIKGGELLASLEDLVRGWLGRKQHEPRESARLVALLLFHPPPP